MNPRDSSLYMNINAINSQDNQAVKHGDTGANGGEVERPLSNYAHELSIQCNVTRKVQVQLQSLQKHLEN
jgi:hypothetical protein